MRDVGEQAGAPALQDAPGPDSTRRSSASQIVAQQAAVAQIGQRALEEESLEALLDETCLLVSGVLDAELASITELAPDRSSLKVIAGVGWQAGIVGTTVVGIGNDSQAGYTLAAGVPVIVDDYATEGRFKVAPSLVDHDAASGMTVRIGGADKPYGVIAAFSKAPGRFTRDDANFLHAVANVLAAAIGRIRIENELRASRDQLAAIVSTIDEGITVLGKGRLEFANDAAARLTGYDSAEDLVNASDEVLSRFEIFDENEQPMATDELPSRRALRGENRPEALVGFRIRATGDTRWSVVRAAAIRGNGGDVSHVINIFRDITDERWAKEARDYMADAVAVLSSTLDSDEAARRLADLSVPRLADYCTVQMLAPDGSISNVAVAHVNPELVEIARRLQRMRPPDPDAPAGGPRVIREGVVEHGTVTRELIDNAPISEEERELVHRLEMRAYVTVPLTGRSAPIGALSLVMAESGRRLGEREIALARELGARAGIALENAQLFQAADARRAELDAVLRALAEAVLVFGAKGELRMANQAAARTFGGNLPKSVEALSERIGIGSEESEQLATGAGIEVELDRRGQWFELRRYQAPGGGRKDGVAPTVVVLRDITDVRAARAARDAFMGVLSHELRTPITTIYGGSELLERGLDEERRAEVISDIRAESERLVRLVEDLLVMTRVERGIVEIADEPILLQHLLASVIHSSGGRWPGVRIELHAADRLPAVKGDATYIEQVVRNLLTNAVRYGRGLESGIDVTAQEDEGFVVVRVLDVGNGFGGEDPEQLFELFYRSSSARSVPGGAGIGLFVCRNLIEKMGGRIWARERPEGGAEFGFSIPVLETDPAA